MVDGEGLYGFGKKLGDSFLACVDPKLVMAPRKSSHIKNAALPAVLPPLDRSTFPPSFRSTFPPLAKVAKIQRLQKRQKPARAGWSVGRSVGRLVTCI